MTPKEHKENEILQTLRSSHRGAALSACMKFIAEALDTLREPVSVIPPEEHKALSHKDFFTVDDIKDKERLERLVEIEANAIMKNAKGSHGRSLDDIKFSVRQGKIAELWLVESGEYSFANKKYHDLVDKSGDLVEVKAYDVPHSNMPYVQNDLRRIRTEGWNHSKYMMLFQCRHGIYKLLEKIDIYANYPNHLQNNKSH